MQDPTAPNGEPQTNPANSTVLSNNGSNERKQPWKGHWPPKAAPPAGGRYSLQKGQTIVIDGN